MDPQNLNFNPGKGVQEVIKARFGEPINFAPDVGLKEFFLVASVGRCKLKLYEYSIGIILQATTGGYPADFRLVFLSDQVFRFSVASHNVGFHIHKLRSFSFDHYSVFFHLWGNGGPNWHAEFRLYLQEQIDEWTKVLPKSEKKKYYAAAVKSSRHLSGANKVSLGDHKLGSAHHSVFDRIQWPRQQQRFHPRVVAEGAKDFSLHSEFQRGRQPYHYSNLFP
jgi:hypothetical protein